MVHIEDAFEDASIETTLSKSIKYIVQYQVNKSLHHGAQKSQNFALR